MPRNGGRSSRSSGLRRSEPRRPVRPLASPSAGASPHPDSQHPIFIFTAAVVARKALWEVPHLFAAPAASRALSAVEPADIQLAARLADKLAALPSGDHWRLQRTLGIYTKTRAAQDILERIHQYCRCIDGLTLPDVGKNKRQFQSRTELFIGPSHHDMMGDLYDIRSNVEHLHEGTYLEHFHRATRLELVQKEAIVEQIVRTAPVRIIGNNTFWPHFANTNALSTFRVDR
jgi:hypothetical protein